MQVGGRRGGVHEYRSAPSPSGTRIKPTEIEFSPRADRAGLRKQGLVCTVTRHPRGLHRRGATPANPSRTTPQISAEVYDRPEWPAAIAPLWYLAKVIGQ